MATKALDSASFQETIDANDIVFVDFWASWCGPCRTFSPIFEAASEAHPEIVFAKVDTEAQQDLASAFGIMSIPTLMIFREQVLLYSQPGALPAASLNQLISQVIELDMDEVHRAVKEAQAESTDAS